MTAYYGGLAILKCAEHDRADEIDSTARLTLAAMGTFCGKDGQPQCFASRGSIAKRAGLSRMSVHRALQRLEKLGLIERDGIKGKTVRWQLTLLADKGQDGQATGITELHKNGVTELHKNGVTVLHNPSDSTDPKGGRERKIGRSAPSPSADAAGSVDATSTLAEQVAKELGLSEALAERWISERVADSKTPVRNIPAFIRACLDRAMADKDATKAKKQIRPDKKDRAAEYECDLCDKMISAGDLCQACCRQEDEREEREARAEQPVRPDKTPTSGRGKKAAKAKGKRTRSIPPDNERCQGTTGKGERCRLRSWVDGYCRTHDTRTAPCTECGNAAYVKDMWEDRCRSCREREWREEQAKVKAEQIARTQAEFKEREANRLAEKAEREAREAKAKAEREAEARADWEAECEAAAAEWEEWEAKLKAEREAAAHTEVTPEVPSTSARAEEIR